MPVVKTLKSPFARPASGRRKSQEATSSTPTQQPAGAVLNLNQLQGGPGESVSDERMFNAADKMALAMVEWLEGYDKKELAPSQLKMVMDAFSTVTQWLSRRQKLRPPEDASGTEGVDMLREMMNDPEKIVDRMHADPRFRAALKKHGFLGPPVKKPKGGRPSKEEAADKDAYEKRMAILNPSEAADDSQLARMIGKVK